MFRNWGFLLGEMIVLIIIAALLGLFVGWLIWGRRRVDTSSEVAELRRALDDCKASHADKDARIATLQGQLDGASDGAALAAVQAQLDACRAEHAEKDAKIKALQSAEPLAAAAPAQPAAVDYDSDGVIEGANEGEKPATLDAARGGAPDDLKQIKGIGPKLEILCNRLGFYHFDQIAAWTDQEVAWVDANLEGFKGRVSRDNWVAQAKVLAEGGTTEFSSRVKDGDVY